MDRAATDVELLSRAREGENAALQELMARHQQALENYIVKKYPLLANQVEDVLQEVWMDAQGGKTVLDPTRSVRPLLLTIARARSIDALRKLDGASAHGIDELNDVAAVDERVVYYDHDDKDDDDAEAKIGPDIVTRRKRAAPKRGGRSNASSPAPSVGSSAPSAIDSPAPRARASAPRVLWLLPERPELADLRQHLGVGEDLRTWTELNDDPERLTTDFLAFDTVVVGPYWDTKGQGVDRGGLAWLALSEFRRKRGVVVVLLPGRGFRIPGMDVDATAWTNLFREISRAPTLHFLQGCGIPLSARPKATTEAIETIPEARAWAERHCSGLPDGIYGLAFQPMIQYEHGSVIAGFARAGEAQVIVLPFDRDCFLEEDLAIVRALAKATLDRPELVRLFTDLDPPRFRNNTFRLIDRSSGGVSSVRLPAKLGAFTTAFLQELARNPGNPRVSHVDVMRRLVAFGRAVKGDKISRLKREANDAFATFFEKIGATPYNVFAGTGREMWLTFQDQFVFDAEGAVAIAPGKESPSNSKRPRS